MKSKYSVQGMMCSACSANVEKSVKKLMGVKDVSVSLLTNSMIVEHDKMLSYKEIINAVEKAGYTAQLKQRNTDKRSGVEEKESLKNIYKKQANKLKKQFIYSLLFLLPLMYISMGKMIGLPLLMFFKDEKYIIVSAFTQFLLTIPIIILNYEYFKRGFLNLFRKAPNMDSLIAIGSSGAFIYGIFVIYQIGFAMCNGKYDIVSEYSTRLYFESSAMIPTIISLGKFLETKSKGKTSETVEKLMELVPKDVVVVRNGIEKTINSRDVIVDDIVICKNGQNISVDGIIVEGSASIDESAITGESIPIEKVVGDTVISGTTNNDGYIKIRATSTSENSTLSKIVDLVTDTIASKAPISKLADKVSGIFVPIVMLIAFFTIITWLVIGKDFAFALSMGISVLVVSCPCALGLATPTAIMVGTGNGARKGILFKNAECLEIAYKTNSIVLDKTGTITKGKPYVTDICIFDNLINEKELLNYVYALEKKSEHLFAKAIVEKIGEHTEECEIRDFMIYKGNGVEGKILANEKYVSILIGNINLMKEKNIKNIKEKYISKVNEWTQQAKTPIYIAKENEVVGLIAIRDEVKQSSKVAIEELKKLDLDIYMLTGDNEQTARVIAKEVGIEKIIAEVKPEEKENVVRKIQENGNITLMVGDGTNDAPALVRADVGVAIGKGTDIAIESADIVLVKNDLLDLVKTIKLSKATIKNIKQNLFWAFFYNIMGIPLAAGVLYSEFGLRLSPMIASAMMSLSSLFVVSNALRLRKFDTTIKTYDKKELQSKEMQNNNNILNYKEKENMVMIIEGMMCGHCTARVEKVLTALDGVKKVEMSLENKSATLTFENGTNIDNELLKKTVENEGYEVLEIK